MVRGAGRGRTGRLIVGYLSVLCACWNRTFLERKVPKELLQRSSPWDDHVFSPPRSLGCDFPARRAWGSRPLLARPPENPAQPIGQTRPEHPVGMRSEVFLGSFCSQPTLPASAMQTQFANCRAARRKTSAAKLKRTVPSNHRAPRLKREIVKMCWHVLTRFPKARGRRSRDRITRTEKSG